MRARWPVLDHLVTLTDGVGLFQHARYDVPNRDFGYCVDDVGRALIVACEAARRPEHAAVGTRLVETYLAFLADAQLADGWFHNFMGYDRRWQDERSSEDAFGRALWGLGRAAVRAPRATWRTLARELVDAAIPHITELTYPRARAYATLGLVCYPADPRVLRDAVAPIAQAYADACRLDWPWCEDVMTYDNGRLCEALIRAGDALGDRSFVDAGLIMLDFLADVCIEDGIFVPVGNAGWFPRGGTRARYGQQPLEAAAMVDAALAAFVVTSDERYRRLATVAGAWFDGVNSANGELVVNGGCRDGIDAEGVSPNMGAESTVSYLLSAIALAEAVPQDLRLVR